jgi:hypothetical protein
MMANTIRIQCFKWKSPIPRILWEDMAKKCPGYETKEKEND